MVCMTHKTVKNDTLSDQNLKPNINSRIISFSNQIQRVAFYVKNYAHEITKHIKDIFEKVHKITFFTRKW